MRGKHDWNNNISMHRNVTTLAPDAIAYPILDVYVFSGRKWLGRTTAFARRLRIFHPPSDLNALNPNPFTLCLVPRTAVL